MTEEFYAPLGACLITFVTLRITDMTLRLFNSLSSKAIAFVSS